MGTVKFFVLLGPLHRRCEHLTTMGATRAFWHARPTFAASSCSAPFLGRRAPLTSSRAPFAASGCDARSSASAAQGRGELLSKRGPRSPPMRLSISISSDGNDSSPFLGTSGIATAVSAAAAAPGQCLGHRCAHSRRLDRRCRRACRRRLIAGVLTRTKNVMSSNVPNISI